MAEPYSPKAPVRPRQDWWVVLGMSVTAVASAVSSFTGLRSLAVATGWQEVLSPLLPLTVDAYAMTATRVWLAASTRSTRARRFARSNAIGAVGLSLLGNGVWHLVEAHVITVTWPIVVLVGAVPPAVLGMLSHLAVLRTQVDPEAVPERTPATQMPATEVAVRDGFSPTQEYGANRRPVAAVEDGTGGAGDGQPRRSRTPRRSRPAKPRRTDSRGPDELLAAARQTNDAHNAQHGRSISRDALRKKLRVSSQQATDLLRTVKGKDGDGTDAPENLPEVTDPPTEGGSMA